MKRVFISVLCMVAIMACLFLVLSTLRSKTITPAVIANLEALSDDEFPHQNNRGTCGYGGIDNDMLLIAECSLPQSEVVEWYNNNRGKYSCMGWCCDSCSQTWYCGSGNELDCE